MFDQNGHLRDQAIAALVSGEELDALTRLELAEHLSYCDFCLQRYTDALAGNLLLTPEVSCRHTIWRKIRERTVRTLTSRYATAAAAMALALTLVCWFSCVSRLVLVFFLCSICSPVAHSLMLQYSH